MLCIAAAASQRLHQARRGVHSYVQAAAAARVVGGRDFYQAATAARVAGGGNIFVSAQDGDGVSVLCHVIADADAVNKRDR